MRNCKIPIWVLVAGLFLGFSCSNGTTETESCDECEPQERSCIGNDSVLCGDYDGDGCMEWGAHKSCGELQCRVGVCVLACMSQCEVAGDRQCAQGGFQICEDSNQDGCLEWGPPTPCTGGSCQDGYCTECLQECSYPGERKCDANGYRECVDHNNDGCLVWSEVVPCPDGESCQGGACRDTGGECFDDEFEENDGSLSASIISQGRYEDLRICPYDEDWYAVELTTGQDLRVEINYLYLEGDLELHAFDSALNLLAESVNQSNNERVELTASAAGTYYIQVSGRAEAGNSYTMDLVEGGGGGCSDDAYEDNDALHQGAALSVGYYGNLQICEGDQDWFYLHLQDRDEIQVSMNYDNLAGAMELRLYDQYGTQLSQSTSGSGSEQVTHTVDGTARYYFEVQCPGGCSNAYNLDISVTSQQCNDDQYEENDSRHSAASISEGNIDGLQVCANDEDWYSVYLGQGMALTAGIYFTNSDGNLDLELYDEYQSRVEWSNGHTDSEVVNHTSLQGGQYTLRVFGLNLAENDYSLRITTQQSEVCLDDPYEDNDWRWEARNLQVHDGPNYFNQLQLCRWDNDYYRVYLSYDQTLEVSIYFTHWLGDLDLYLEDDWGNTIAYSEGYGNSEWVSVWVMDSGYYFIKVAGFGRENRYDMVVDLSWY